jgi:PAS domain S-box-containing protein
MHYSIDQAGVWVDCFHEKKPIVHNDYSSLQHKKGMPEGHVEVTRELAVPIIREGKVMAILGLGNKPADYTEKDVETVSYLADETWLIVDKKRTERKLLENEQHFRNLADSGQALVWTSGTDKQCNYFNKVWLDFTGRSLEEELGNGWVEGVHPDDLTHCMGTYMSAFDRQEPFSMIYRLRRHDSVYRWIQDDGTPRYDSTGLFMGYIGHCLDITEFMLAKERIAHLNNVLRAIRDVNQLIVHERDRTALINKGCRLLVDNRGYTATLIILVNETGRPVSWAQAGMDGTFEALQALLKNGGLPPCCNRARLSDEVQSMAAQTLATWLPGWTSAWVWMPRNVTSLLKWPVTWPMPFIPCRRKKRMRSRSRSASHWKPS